MIFIKNESILCFLFIIIIFIYSLKGKKISAEDDFSRFMALLFVLFINYHIYLFFIRHLVYILFINQHIREYYPEKDRT